MTEQEIYFAEQEFNRFEMIINTKEYLTKEEYDFCVAYDNEVKSNLTYIGYSQYGDYLNLNVYSEHDHDKRQYELETT
jgi:hypothetical protein